MHEVLGGPLSPIGWDVGWIEAPLPNVLEAIRDWRNRIDWQFEVSALQTQWPANLMTLDPLEAPWTTEVLIDHRSTWTCYLNNALSGGDTFPVTSYISGVLETRGVISVHHPMDESPRHASTQFQLLSPEGEPPLMYQRTLAAHCQDGRWSWHESGDPLPFERTDRYKSRLKRDRLDRALLVEYLGALGIDVDDPSAYGESMSLRRKITWTTRRMTLADARAERGLR